MTAAGVCAPARGDEFGTAHRLAAPTAPGGSTYRRQSVTMSAGPARFLVRTLVRCLYVDFGRLASDF